MRVLLPKSLDEALAIRAETRAVPMAGGTDLLVHWPVRIETRAVEYVDLWRLEELRYHHWMDEALELGALATYWDLVTDRETRAAFPLLGEAGRQVGAIQIQARGTWAGNIANGSPAADGVPVLMAYDAAVVLASTRGRREVPLDGFYRGYKEMEIEPDELIVAIRIPRRRHAVQRFVKVGSRRAQAIAKVGVAITGSDAGWRVVASSVAPTVRRCPTVESLLAAGDRPAAPADLLPALRADVAPIDDLRSTAAYREAVLARILYAEWPS